MKTLNDVLQRTALRHPDAPAVGWSRAMGGHGLTFHQLRVASLRGADAFQRARLRPGEAVVLHMEPRPEWAAAFFSVLEAGLVAVPLAADIPPDGVARIAAFAGARAAVLGERTRRAAAALPGLQCLQAGDLFPLHAPEPPGPPGAATAACDPSLHDWEGAHHTAVLAFTSGSTGLPRGVELSHANILADLAGLLAVRGAGPGDAFLSVLPPAHLFELTAGLMGPVACGARIVYPGCLLPNRLVAALREDQVTHTLCVPALLDALHAEVLEELADSGDIDRSRRGQLPAETARRIRHEFTTDVVEQLREAVRERIGPTLHTLIVGGAAVDGAWTEIAQALGIRLEVGYGLTEAAPVVSLGFAAECPAGSVGRPLPGVEVRVDADEEVRVRGANVMRGYFRDPTLTASVLEDGWLRTGDRGRIDDDGFLFVTGRLKEAIVGANGETVYPEDVEPHYRCALFSEVCVAGLDGPDGNDIPALFAVPASAAVGEDDLREAFEHLRAQAPERFRVQRLVCMPGPLPRTATGKVRRRSLAEACRLAAQP